jgi:hypothetical protein
VAADLEREYLIGAKVELPSGWSFQRVHSRVAKLSIGWDDEASWIKPEPVLLVPCPGVGIAAWDFVGSATGSYPNVSNIHTFDVGSKEPAGTPGV